MEHRQLWNTYSVFGSVWRNTSGGGEARTSIFTGISDKSILQPLLRIGTNPLLGQKRMLDCSAVRRRIRKRDFYSWNDSVAVRRSISVRSSYLTETLVPAARNLLDTSIRELEGIRSRRLFEVTSCGLEEICMNLLQNTWHHVPGVWYILETRTQSLQLPAYLGFDLITSETATFPVTPCCRKWKEGKEIAAVYWVCGAYPPFSRDVAPSDFHFCGRLTVYFEVQRFWHDEVKTDGHHNPSGVTGLSTSNWKRWGGL